MTDRTPMAGPFRVSVDRTPSGVALDVSHFVERLVLDLVTEHADALAEILAEQAEDRPYDGHRPETLLVEQLVDALDTRIPVYGVQCRRLADRIRAAAGPVAEGGAAA